LEENCRLSAIEACVVFTMGDVFVVHLYLSIVMAL
jgi:hypothetical protein